MGKEDISVALTSGKTLVLKIWAGGEGARLDIAILNYRPQARWDEDVDVQLQFRPGDAVAITRAMLNLVAETWPEALALTDPAERLANGKTKVSVALTRGRTLLLQVWVGDDGAMLNVTILNYREKPTGKWEEDRAVRLQFGSSDAVAITKALLSVVAKTWPEALASTDPAKRLPNLAFTADDATAKLELDTAQISCSILPESCRSHNETRIAVMGSLHHWTFRRAWTYWVCEGAGIPPEPAARLYRDFGGEVRVDGNATGPDPRDVVGGLGVNLYHVDTLRGLLALADTIRDCE